MTDTYTVRVRSADGYALETYVSAVSYAQALVARNELAKFASKLTRITLLETGDYSDVPSHSALFRKQAS